MLDAEHGLVVLRTTPGPDFRPHDTAGKHSSACPIERPQERDEVVIGADTEADGIGVRKTRTVELTALDRPQCHHHVEREREVGQPDAGTALVPYLSRARRLKAARRGGQVPE